ncbi:MAG: HD domain-containing protein [Atribacterota bacterium]|nr:HD domain-containing protein [Atribacterota bacterium]
MTKMDYLALLSETEQKKLLTNFSLMTDSSIFLLNENKELIFSIQARNTQEKDNKSEIDTVDRDNANKVKGSISFSPRQKDYQRLLKDLYEQKVPLSCSYDHRYSLAGEPLIFHNNFLGVLLFAYPTSSTSIFTSQMEFLRQYLKNLFVCHYELDNLSEEVVYNYEEFSLLTEISQLLGGILEESKICQIVIEKIQKTIPAKSIVVLLKEEKEDYFYLVAAQGLKPKRLIPEKINTQQGICGWITKIDQSILINTEEQFYLPLDFKKEECQSCPLCQLPFIFVPLKSGNKVIGLINVSRKVSGKNKGQDFTSRNLKLIELIATQVGFSLGNIRLSKEREKILLGILDSLVATIEAKDPYSSGHSKRVSHYTQALCENLDLSEEVKKELVISALLHDIGKIGVPEDVLLKPGKLTPEDWKIIRNHPKRGLMIVKNINGFHDVITGIYSHHERYDGKGYPDGLKGEEIPLAGRIIAIADTFDALTTKRPYRKAFTVTQALSLMAENQGTQFDPHLLDLFLSCVKKGKIKKIK